MRAEDNYGANMRTIVRRHLKRSYFVIYRGERELRLRNIKEGRT